MPLHYSHKFLQHHRYNEFTMFTLWCLEIEKETDSLCSSKGNVQLDGFPQVQAFLQHLHEGIDSNGKHFLANMQKCNAVLLYFK